MLIGSGIIFITNADTNFPLDELILNLSIKQLGKFLINFVSFYLHKWRIQENYFHKDRVACVVNALFLLPEYFKIRNKTRVLNSANKIYSEDKNFVIKRFTLFI